MSKPVVHVLLHQGLFIPGIGDFGKTLPPTNKRIDLKLRYDSDGLHFESNGKKGLIPAGNIAYLVFGPEEKK